MDAHDLELDALHATVQSYGALGHWEWMDGTLKWIENRVEATILVWIGFNHPTIWTGLGCEHLSEVAVLLWFEVGIGLDLSPLASLVEITGWLFGFLQFHIEQITHVA